MGIKKTKGLKGIPSIAEQRKQELEPLRSWNDLSIDERQAFLDEYPSLNGKSFKQVSAAYDNRNYVKALGMDDFQEHTDKAERDERYRKYILGQAAEKIFGKESDDVKQKIATLTDEGLEELINSGYSTVDDFKRYNEEFDEMAKDRKSSVWKQLLTGLADNDDMNFQETPEKMRESFMQKHKENNESILSSLVANDNRRKTEGAIPLTERYNEELTKMGSDFVNDGFDKLVNGQNIDTGYGTTIREDGIGLYKIYEGRHEMRDFGYEEKKKMLAQYYALLDIYKNPEIAKQALTTELQDYIHKGQNAWDWWSSAISGIGTKATADFMQTYLGVAALWGDALWGDEWLAKFLQGKDENGNERALMNNLRYWNGVDMYNTFSNDLIGKVEDNGGISPYNWLSEAGNERNIISALNEGVKMTGYMLAQMALARGIGKGFGKIAEGAGGVFRAGQFVVEGSTPQALRIMKYYAPLTTSAINAISISTGYAKGSFDKTYQEENQKLNLMKEAEAADYVDGILGENSGIKWTDHGFEGSKEVFGSNDRAAEMNGWIAAQAEKLEANGQRVDLDELANQALYYYKEHKRQEYIDNLNDSLFWKNADRRAIKDAANAYEMNASIEFLRMCGVNYIFKSFLNDKSVRRAQAANYPGLAVGKGASEVEQFAMRGSLLGIDVDPKIARYYGAVKALYGGFESNYFDDVWANFSQAYGKGRFNNYMAYQLDGDKAAYASNWIAGIVSGAHGFEESLVDPQSWYDGLIGALGTVEGAMFRPTMFRNKTLNQYDEMQVNKYAALSGMNAEEYVRGDYNALKERIQRNQVGLTEAQADEMVAKIKDAYAFDKMVKEGNIEELSWIEKADKYFGNPLTQEYADARSREREFKEMIDVKNKTIADKKDAINNIIGAINSVSRRKLEEYGGLVVDMKEAKAFEAFDLIRTLQKWSEDPVLSQSEFVQNSQQRLQDLADGKITEDDIISFLADADNKSELGTGNEEQTARERIQSNAQQLLDVQEQYNKALKEIKESDGYMMMKDADIFEDLLTELVFNRVMEAQRNKRIGQMNSEIQGTQQISMESVNDYIARFASEKGYDSSMKALDEQIENAEKEVKQSEQDLREAKRVKGRGKRKVTVQAAELALEEAKYNASNLKMKRRIYEEVHSHGLDFSRVLSKEEILSLAPEERAMMLNPNNLSNYSTEQQAVIKELDGEMRMKDPGYYQKVNDIAELVNRNKDLVHSNWLMEKNMPAALGYFNYARQIRQQQATRALQLQQFDRKSGELENAPSAEVRNRIAKGTGYAFLSDYIDKHPEHKDELNDTLGLLKLKNDFKTSTVSALAAISKQWTDGGISVQAADSHITALERILNGFVRGFNAIMQGDDVQTEQDMMGKLEEWSAQMEDGKGYFDKVMEELVKLNHQRNATKIQELADKKAAEEYRKQQAYNALGKNFGFDGYVKGDFVYRKDGKVGTVVEFAKTDGDSRMRVSWTDTDGMITDYNPEQASNELSKTPLQEEKKDNTPAPTPKPAPQPAVDEKVFTEGIREEDLFDFTPDGQMVSKSEEEQASIASRQSKGDSFVVDNIDRGVISLAEAYHAGLLVGNALYEYDLKALDGLKIQKRRTPRSSTDTMSAFFNWLDNKGIKLQEIIDNELHRIVKANPKVLVKFMIVNEPGMEMHILEVLDYEGAVKKIHNEEAIKKWGKPVEVGGKEYLVIGTVGYNRDRKDPFMRIANIVRDGAREHRAFADGNTMYVHQDAYTHIARIGTGHIFKQGIGEDVAQFRTLGELFADPVRNPNRITFANAVMGIMYANQYFVANRTPTDGVIVPPGKSDSTLGRVFLMVKATNGNYSPIALRNDIYFNDLKEGEYKDKLFNLIRDLGSPSYDVRRKALIELSKRLVLDNVSNIKIGSPTDNRVTIIRNGTKAWSKQIDASFPFEVLEREIRNTNFKTNIVQSTLENSTELAQLDAAGGLQTDVSALRTTDASFDVYEVDEKGQPLIIPVGTVDVDTRKENESRKSNRTMINGQKYSLVEGDYYDNNNQRVEDQGLRYSIHWNLRIQREDRVPAFVSPKGTKFYITNSDRENPSAIEVDKAGNVKALPKERALGLIDYAVQKAAEEARIAAAQEEAERLMELAKIQKEGVQGFLDPSEVYVPEEPIAPLKPVENPVQPVVEALVEKESAQFVEDPNKASDKTLTDLQADKKSTKFAFVYMRRMGEFRAIFEEKGWDAGVTGREVQNFLKEKLGASFNPDHIENEEVLIDLIKACR